MLKFSKYPISLKKRNEWILYLKRILDRIYRIIRIIFNLYHFIEESDEI